MGSSQVDILKKNNFWFLNSLGDLLCNVSKYTPNCSKVECNEISFVIRNQKVPDIGTTGENKIDHP